MQNSAPIVPQLQSLSLSHNTTTLEFGQHFSGNKTPAELAAAIDHFLRLHTCNNVHKFHLHFYPSSKPFLPMIDSWVSYAVEKGAGEIVLDFSMGVDDSEENSIDEWKSSPLPVSLFRCDKLTHLSLSYCSFSPPPGFSGFEFLQSLSFSHVSTTGDAFQRFLSSCPLLRSLQIARWESDDPLVVSSQTLRRLTIDNSYCACYDLEISAPCLESFVFYGMHIFGDSFSWPKDTFVDISSLSDAFICAVESSEPEHDFIKLVHDLRHVRILTLCEQALWCVAFRGWHELLPISLQNLKELQLLVGFLSTGLEGIYGFFQHCPSPFIQKLFIQLSSYDGELEESMTNLKFEVQEPTEVGFENLKAIKVSNFIGCKAGMRLVSFLLQKAVNLESMVIVAHPRLSNQSMDMEETAAMRKTDLTNLHRQLPLLPKASPQARILLLEHQEDDMSLAPIHTEYFGEY